MAIGNLAVAERREEARDEVHYRTRGVTHDGRTLPLLVVNISAHGLMARCELMTRPGDKLRLTLPGVGQTIGEVRWSLGGRLGCQFDRPIPMADYYDLLAVLLKS